MYSDYLADIDGGEFTPEIVNVSNTKLVNFYRKYLLQKALAIYKIKVPDTWDINYFRNALFQSGRVCIFRTAKYGVIPQACGLTGYDVFYRPNVAIVTNPCLPDVHQLRIGRDCTVIRLLPNYGGIMDIVNHYANLMALTVQTLGVNIQNSKLSYVFTADSDAQAKTLKLLYDKISKGEPAVVVSKKSAVSVDGDKAWDLFTQNVGANYIGNQLLEDLRKIEQMFDTEVGIPNANTTKKERMITDEVESNDIETQAKADLWMAEIQRGVAQANKMFSLDITIDWRYQHEQTTDHDQYNVSV